MGKIYDALKRAEEESKINKIKHRAADTSSEPSTDLQSKATHPVHLTDDNDSTRPLQKPAKKQTAPSIKLLSPDKLITKEESKSSTILQRLIGKNIVSSNEPEQGLFTINHPNSLISEQYTTLTTRIVSFCKEKNLKTIFVTSALANEGKSTVASNLSICIARSMNEHALLMDCDLRKPTIHKLFNIDNHTGLSNYLNGDSSLSPTLNRTLLGKLTIIPSGVHTENPAELLSSKKMFNLIEELKSRYDDRYVIVDSTPSWQTPEAAFLAKYFDCILFVVRAGTTHREILLKTLDSLNRNKIIGVVFNMANEHIKSYNTSYNYYYSKEKS